MEEQIKKILASGVHYPISFEIEAPFAMFSRPDSGSEKTSYPLPPFSVAKGIFESILYMPTVYVIPTKVQICKPIKYYSYPFNYNGELRKKNLIKDGNTCQIKTTILSNVCYRLFAYVINNNDQNVSEAAMKWQGVNHAHSYQEQFNRRLVRGQNCEKPFLGISEFLPSYVGVFREKTEIQKDINFVLSSMVFFNFDSLNKGKHLKDNPFVSQNVEINQGEVQYVK